MVVNRNEPRRFGHARVIKTTGSQWSTFLSDITRYFATSEKNRKLTEMVWVIPPNQDIVDKAMFLDYSRCTEEMRNTIYFSDCIDRTGNRVPNGGPILVPSNFIGDYKIKHIDQIATHHRGYQVGFVSREYDSLPELCLSSERYWAVPPDCSVKGFDFDKMIPPDAAPDRYTYRTPLRSRLGVTPDGPILMSRQPRFEEVFAHDVIDGMIAQHTPVPSDRRYPLVMLHLDEPNFSQNFDQMRKVYSPGLSRKLSVVHGATSIADAHNRAVQFPEVRGSEYVWIADADFYIRDDFDFDVQVPEFSPESVYVWKARNSVNKLRYGNGGLKLIHTHLCYMTTVYVDYSMRIAKNGRYHVVPELAGETRIDGSPYQAWRAGFREAMKLASNGDKESKLRLDIWTNVSNGTENGLFAMKGARHAVESQHRDRTLLDFVNNYAWLKDRYERYEKWLKND